MTSPPKTSPRKKRGKHAFVDDIARRHFGEPARRVVEQGGGLTNAVYRFKVSPGEFIVRAHADATKISSYIKEQWAMDAARAVGVPVPKVLEVGNFADGRAYMIQECVAGIEARLSAQPLATVAEIGRLTALLHTVRTNGYGSVFDWSSNQLSLHERWADYLLRELDVEGRLDVLLKHRTIERSQATALRKTAATMARWKRPAVLHHGDLRLKNVLVEPESGRVVAVIDWETCVSSPGPYWDLSLALHDLGIDAKEAFLEGYGLKARAFHEAVPFMRLFNVLNYAPHVASAVRRRDRARLEWYRLRLHGELDLYQHHP